MSVKSVIQLLALTGAAVATPNSNKGHTWNPHGHYISFYSEPNYRGYHNLHEVVFSECTVFDGVIITKDHYRSWRGPDDVRCTFFTDIHCQDRYGDSIDIPIIEGTTRVPSAYYCFVPSSH